MKSRPPGRKQKTERARSSTNSYQRSLPESPPLFIVAVCIALAELVWISFGSAIRNGFVNFDDDGYVYQNPNVTSGLTLAGVRWAFSSVHEFNWHPLTTISHMLDCQLYGLQPWGHHLTNILLHATAAVLLFLALKQLTESGVAASLSRGEGLSQKDKTRRQSAVATSLWPSAFVATLFAIHPLRVESVAWISERKDVLSGVFFMLTLLAYGRYAKSERFFVGRYLTVTVLFALGLMCKPTLVTLPFLLLLLDYWPLARCQRTRKASVAALVPSAERKNKAFDTNASTTRGLVVEKIPLFILSAVSCVVTIIAQKGALNTIRNVAFPERFANAVISYVTYLAQTVWPVHLAALYPYNEHGFSILGVVLALLLLSLISVVVWMYRKPYPFLLIGWLWFLGTLVPMSGIVQVGWQSRADRYTYLPQIGLFLAITWGVTESFKKSPHYRQLSAVAGMFIIVLLILSTRAQTASWKNSVTMWQHTIANTPNNYVAYNNLGIALSADGQLDEAVGAYEKAIQSNSSPAEAEYNLGNVFVLKHNVREAIAHYQTALRLRPDYPEAEYNLGSALFQSGQQYSAIYHYEKAVELKPDSAEMQANLANVLWMTGEVSQAIEHYRRAVAIKPDSVEMECHLGDALASTSDLAGAIACYQTATRLQPENAKVHNDLGILLTKLEKSDEAVGEFQRALQISPNYAEAQYNMGSLLARLGRKQEAAMHLTEAVRLKPDYAEAKDQLRELGAPLPQ